MAASVRIARLERRIEALERSALRRETREELRVRARRLVLEHLHRHKTIDGVRFAAKHGLVFNDVDEALQELEKLGSVGPVMD